MLKKSALFLSFCCIAATTFAQDMNLTQEEPTDFMNSNGKIYVVMTVAIVIVCGLFIYLMNLDRKIKKLEQQSTTKS